MNQLDEFYPFAGEKGRFSHGTAFRMAVLKIVLALAVGLAGPAYAQTVQSDLTARSDPGATYKYEGNIESRKFHQSNCPYSRVMAPFRKISLESYEVAVAHGFSACRFCLAPYELSVEARIIHPDISR